MYRAVIAAALIAAGATSASAHGFGDHRHYGSSHYGSGHYSSGHYGRGPVVVLPHRPYVMPPPRRHWYGPSRFHRPYWPHRRWGW